MLWRVFLGDECDTSCFFHLCFVHENLSDQSFTGYMRPNRLLQAPAEAISYDMNSIAPNDYQDRVAFNTPFTEETKALEEIGDLLVRGQRFISLLYTYRSCSKALPMVQQETEEKFRNDIHKKTFDILRPEIQKLKEFMDFHEHVVKVFSNNLSV